MDAKILSIVSDPVRSAAIKMKNPEKYATEFEIDF